MASDALELKGEERLLHNTELITPDAPTTFTSIHPKCKEGQSSGSPLPPSTRMLFLMFLLYPFSLLLIFDEVPFVIFPKFACCQQNLTRQLMTKNYLAALRSVQVKRKVSRRQRMDL